MLTPPTPSPSPRRGRGGAGSAGSEQVGQPVAVQAGEAGDEPVFEAVSAFGIKAQVYVPGLELNVSAPGDIARLAEDHPVPSDDHLCPDGCPRGTSLPEQAQDRVAGELKTGVGCRAIGKRHKGRQVIGRDRIL